MYNNAGILNKVFYEAAMACGGYSWTTIGPIWYQLSQQLSPRPDFDEFKDTLKSVARSTMYQEQIEDALRSVGFE